jgi:hypothetical protein
MNKLILRGATIRFVDIRKGATGILVKLNMTADFTDVVRNEMGWGEAAEGFNSGDLEGELAASHAILTPNDRTLRQSNELQFDVLKADRFQYFRTVDHSNSTTSEELRFCLHSAMEGVGALAENYLRAVGDKVAQLRISYTPEPVQQTLPTGEEQPTLAGAIAEQPETDCVDCANGIGFMDGDPSTHASGQPCVAYSGGTGGPALSTAREAAGGTHQKRKRGGSGPIVDTTVVN